MFDVPWGWLYLSTQKKEHVCGISPWQPALLLGSAFAPQHQLPTQQSMELRAHWWAAAMAEGPTDPTMVTPAILQPLSLPVPLGKVSDGSLSKGLLD